MQTSSAAVAVHQTVRPNLSTTTAGPSGSPQSGNWLKFGDSWAVREDRIVLIANLAGYSKVQAFLDSGQVIDIEVPTGGGAAVLALLRDGRDIPQELTKNISVNAP